MGVAHLGRILAVVALVAAIAVLAFLLFFRGQTYTVKAQFESASQIVPGNLVTVAGMPSGVIKEIELSPNGQAELTLEVSDEYAPLRQGTRAVIRQASLSGVANRYVELQMGDGRAAKIPEGGRIDASQTKSNVDLDQIFNTFDPVARTAVQRSFRGFAEMYTGREKQANEAFKYLNPALASSSSLFQEINRNSGFLDRFVVQTAQLVGDVAERDDDLAGLVDNLATTSTALANQRRALGESIDRFPTFMRKSNTTFVNLRAALDDLDPLVRESRPTLRRLRPFLRQLRPLAREAVPTLRDFSRTVRQPGADNDLVEFLQAQPAVDRVANQPQQINGQEREGAFPAMRKSLQDSTEQFAFARPYAPELVGWFDDFSTSGATDALGNFSRSGLALSAFSVTSNAGGVLDTVLPVPLPLRDQVNQALGMGSQPGRNDRCPGSNERDLDGSNPPYRPTPNFGCNPDIKPIGP